MASWWFLEIAGWGYNAGELIAKEHRGLSRTIYYITATLFLAAIALLLVGANMRKELSHDEHMYVAGGELLVRGLLPYRDYPYLQMPNLAFVYAGIFAGTGTGHLLLAARLFNTLCAVLSAVVVFVIASAVFRPAGYPIRFFAGAGSVVLLVANPIFIYAGGLAWNHDLPVLLTLLAFGLFRAAVGRARAAWLPAFAGLAMGLAVGTRLAFAPALLPFAIAAFFLPGEAAPRAYGRAGARQRTRLYLLAAFCLGVLVGLLPAIVTAVLAPSQFIFGNASYHGLSETYWRQMGYTRAMSLEGKLGYLIEVAREPGTLAPALTFALFALLLTLLAVAGRARTTLGGFFPMALAGALVVSLLAGALGPTPTWYQYYYALVPFLVLGVAHGAAGLYAGGLSGRWAMALFGPAVLVVGALGISGYARLNPSLRVEDWVPSRVHEAGLEIARAAGTGRVLTLAPLFPLEGGAGIYEQLAAGPFTWRTAGLLPSDERQRLAVVGGDDLDALLRPRPPAGILTGLEPGLEAPLVKYAQAHGYRPRQLSNGATLWLPTP